MSDLQERLQNLNWSSSFDLDLALHPDVFNMFADACNERLATCLRLNEHVPNQWQPTIDREINGYWTYYWTDATLYWHGPAYHIEPNKIYQTPHTDAINHVQHGSIRALGTPNPIFTHVFSIFDEIDKYPIPYNFNIKTNLFSLKQTTSVNNWPWLQSVVAYICFFFIKDQTDEGILDIDKLGELWRYYSWRSTFFDDCEASEISELAPKFFGLGSSLPEDRYGKKDFFVPRIFRRVYPRTITRLDDSGEQGQVARLIAHVSHFTDPEYKNIRFNYHKLYIYDTETGTVKFDEDGEPIFSNWRLLTADEAKTHTNPDFLTSHGFAKVGDYFGPWILEDIRTALNLCRYGQPHDRTQIIFDYSSNQHTTQRYNEADPAYETEAIALELDRVAYPGDSILFLKKPDSRLKEGMYALTGGPNKILQIFDEFIVLENPVLIQMTRSVSFSSQRRTGFYDYMTPLNRYLNIPIIYSGNLPWPGGSNPGVYYPGFDQQSYAVYAAGAPVKQGSLLSYWTLVHPTGYYESYSLLTFFQKDFAKKLKYIHFFKGTERVNTQSEITTANILSWLKSKGHTSVWPGYDLTMLEDLTYEQDHIYGVELQNIIEWDRILLEFEFQYKGA